MTETVLLGSGRWRSKIAGILFLASSSDILGAELAVMTSVPEDVATCASGSMNKELFCE